MRFVCLSLVAILIVMTPLMILSCNATPTFSVTLSEVRHIPKLINGQTDEPSPQPFMAGWMDLGGGYSSTSGYSSTTATMITVSFPNTPDPSVIKGPNNEHPDNWLAAGMFVTGCDSALDQTDYGYYTILVLDPNYNGVFFEAGVYETYEALLTGFPPWYPREYYPWTKLHYSTSALIEGMSPSTEFALSAKWDDATGLINWHITWGINSYDLPSFDLPAVCPTVIHNFEMGTLYVSKWWEQPGLYWMSPYYKVYYYQFGIFSNYNIAQGGWNVLLSHPSYDKNGEWHDIEAASSIGGYDAYMDYRWIWGGEDYEGVGADYDPNLPYFKAKFYYSGSTLEDYTTLKWHPADINHDNIIDIFDIVICGGAFGSKPGDSNWDPRVDLNHDNIVDIFDVVSIVINFGKKFGRDPPSEYTDEKAVVSVCPGEVTVGKYEDFSVNVTVTNATNLYGYEFKLYYDTSILNCTGITFPSDHFLQPILDPGNIYIVKQEYNNAYNATHGRVWVAASLMSPEQPRNGSGTLATITFKALAAGTSALNLQDIKLSNMEAEAIPATLVDSSATVNNNRYMRSDQHSVNGLTAYNLGSTQSNDMCSVERSDWGHSVDWGIRVWVRNVNETETELTGGTPVAQVGRSSNGEGIQSSNWSCPETSLANSDAIVIRVYTKLGSGSWTICANFITAQLSAGTLQNSTWTVHYYTKAQFVYVPYYHTYRAIGTYYWGTTTYNSHIENL